VNQCQIPECQLFPFRMGTGEQDAMARAKAIHEYCRWCTLEQLTEIKACPSQLCPLFPYRLSRIDRSVEIDCEAGKHDIEAVSDMGNASYIPAYGLNQTGPQNPAVMTTGTDKI
jgi:hypothetical protein